MCMYLLHKKLLTLTGYEEGNWRDEKKQREESLII